MADGALNNVSSADKRLYLRSKPFVAGGETRASCEAETQGETLIYASLVRIDTAPLKQSAHK